MLFGRIGFEHMNVTTEPIRDKKKLNQLLDYLKVQNDRNYLMAKVQLNTALRLSDVINLRVVDFLYPSSKFKNYLYVMEKKTGKRKKIMINTLLAQSIKEYIQENQLQLEDYLFSTPRHRDRHITQTQAHRIYQAAAKSLHLEKFNSHSLRKTWGYHAYKETKNIAIIMQVYGHVSLKDTFRYIGITQEDMNNMYKKIKF